MMDQGCFLQFCQGHKRALCLCILILPNDPYLHRNPNTREGNWERQGGVGIQIMNLLPAVGKCKLCKQMILRALLDNHAQFKSSHKPTNLCVCFCGTASSAMLHRNMRTAGVELPEVGSKDVPLIGYRPLPPDTGGPPGQWGKEANAGESISSQVRLKGLWWLSFIQVVHPVVPLSCNLVILDLSQDRRANTSS